MAQEQGTHTLTATLCDPAGRRFTLTFSGTAANWLHALRVAAIISQGNIYGKMLQESVNAVPGLEMKVEAGQ